MSYAHLSAQQRSALSKAPLLAAAGLVSPEERENLTNIFRNDLHGGSHVAPSIGTSKLRALRLLPELTHRSVSSVRGSGK